MGIKAASKQIQNKVMPVVYNKLSSEEKLGKRAYRNVHYITVLNCVNSV